MGWTLIVHRLRHIARSPYWRVGSAAYAVLFALVGVYLFASVILIGFFLTAGIEAALPGTDAMGFARDHYLLFCVLVCIWRAVAQPLPRVNLQPYLHLPWRRGSLLNLYAASTLFGGHILFSLGFLVSFWLGNLAAEASWLWLLGSALILGAANYIGVLLRLLLLRFPLATVVSMAASVAVIVVDVRADSAALAGVSSFLFRAMADGDILLIAAEAAAVAGLHVALVRALRGYAYVDTLSFAKPWDWFSRAPAGWARRFGNVGRLIGLELLLITRNRHTRQLVAVALFGIPMGIFLYFTPRPPGNEFFGMAIYGALLSSGTFATYYGYASLGWNSTFFDGMLTRPISARDSTLAKILVLQGSCLVFFAVGIPAFLLVVPRSVPLFAVFALYNAGVLVPIVVFSATWNERRINLDDGPFFAGGNPSFGPPVWAAIVSVGLPMALSFVFFSRPGLGLLVLGLGSSVSLVLTPYWAAKCGRALTKRTHVMSAGFRVMN